MPGRRVTCARGATRPGLALRFDVAGGCTVAAAESRAASLPRPTDRARDVAPDARRKAAHAPIVGSLFQALSRQRLHATQATSPRAELTHNPRRSPHLAQTPGIRGTDCDNCDPRNPNCRGGRVIKHGWRWCIFFTCFGRWLSFVSVSVSVSVSVCVCVCVCVCVRAWRPLRRDAHRRSVHPVPTPRLTLLRAGRERFL